MFIWIFRIIASILVGFSIIKLINKSRNKHAIIDEDKNVIKFYMDLDYSGVKMILISAIPSLLFSFVLSEGEDRTFLVIIFGVFMFIGLFLIMSYERYKVLIYNDNIVICRLFRNYHLLYKDITVQMSGNNYVIYHNEKKFHVSILSKNSEKLHLQILKFQKENNITPKLISRITPNFYSRNFGIAFLIIGLFLLTLNIVVHSDPIDTLDWITMILGALSFLIGVYFLLIYNVWLVFWEGNILVYRNIFFKKREYILNDLIWKPTNNGYTLYENKKRLLYINDKLFDSSDSLIYKIQECKNKAAN